MNGVDLTVDMFTKEIENCRANQLSCKCYNDIERQIELTVNSEIYFRCNFIFGNVNCNFLYFTLNKSRFLYRDTIESRI